MPGGDAWQAMQKRSSGVHSGLAWYKSGTLVFLTLQAHKAWGGICTLLLAGTAMENKIETQALGHTRPSEALV